jgi:hypothetical protein
VCALGLARLAWPRRPERWAVLGVAGAVPLALTVAGLRGQFFHHRFVFWGLIAVVMGLAAGSDLVARALARATGPARRAVPALLVAIALAGYAALAAPRLAELRARPHSPIRDALAWIQSDGGERALRVGYGKGGDMSAIYDPWLVFATNAGPIEELAQRARAEGRPLYVMYGYPGENRQRFPGAFALLDDPQLFEERARFLGVAPEFTWRVLRYTGAPLP